MKCQLDHRLFAVFAITALAACTAEETATPEQTPSEISQEDTCSTCCPPAPSATMAKATGAGTLRVTWNDNSLIESGFIVERSENGGGWVPISQPGPNVESDIDGGYSGASSFRYRVSAFNAVCTSSPSPIAIVPKAPTNLVGVVVSGATFKLTWTDRSNNETGFVAQKKAGTAPWGDNQSVGADMTTTNVMLSPGANRFRVRAVSATGASWYTNEVSHSF